jgi:hypothetical protein
MTNERATCPVASIQSFSVTMCLWTLAEASFAGSCGSFRFATSGFLTSEVPSQQNC